MDIKFTIDEDEILKSSKKMLIRKVEQELKEEIIEEINEITEKIVQKYVGSYDFDCIIHEEMKSYVEGKIALATRWQYGDKSHYEELKKYAEEVVAEIKEGKRGDEILHMVASSIANSFRWDRQKRDKLAEAIIAMMGEKQEGENNG